MTTRRWIVEVAVNAFLAGAIGALLGGLKGAQIGWIGGLALAALPLVTTAARSYFASPGSLPRFLARQLADVAVGAASSLAIGIGRLLSPLSAVLRLPMLLARIVASMLEAAAASLLARLFRLIATPLGLANVGALAIIAADRAGIEFASMAVVVGLLALILVLVVSVSETGITESTHVDPKGKADD